MTSVNDTVKRNRFNTFKRAVDQVETHYSRETIGRLFAIGEKRSARYEVDRKMRDPSMTSARMPTRSDVLAIQLAELLRLEGYELDSFQFSGDGTLVEAPKKA